jgi:hypothetical protein
MHANEMPASMQLLAVQRKEQVTFPETLVRIPFRIPVSAVPDHDRAATVLALRYRSLEAVVFDRVIFDFDGKPPLTGNQARPPGHRPALHHAAMLEPQIVVQPTGSVFLNDELLATAARRAPTRFGRDVELALLTIELEAHVQTICGARGLLARDETVIANPVTMSAQLRSRLSIQ